MSNSVLSTVVTGAKMYSIILRSVKKFFHFKSSSSRIKSPINSGRNLARHQACVAVENDK